MGRHHARTHDYTESRNKLVFIERMPDSVYLELLKFFKTDYGFINGQRDRMAEYLIWTGSFPPAVLPSGFSPIAGNLVPLEQKNGFSFAYFDAAVTEQGLRIVEFQAFPTHSVIAARMNAFLSDRLSLSAALQFPNDPYAGQENFLGLMKDIVCGEEEEGIVIVDRNIAGQKTNFSFYAMRHALGGRAEVVDAAEIFAQGEQLFYRTGGRIKKVRRFYNRLVPTEAIKEEKYPTASDRLSFRFDRPYKDMLFVNHPCQYFEFSKRLLPYISDPLNPPCYELQETAEDFLSGRLNCSQFVWKDTWGYAGLSNLLVPNREILDRLIRKGQAERYIAQQKIPFEVFRTGDELKKIVELRFMTVQSDEKLLVVPMARIGHAEHNAQGEAVYKVHFGDNTMPGYGFAPVLIFE